MAPQSSSMVTHHDPDLVSELDLGSARGARHKGPPLTVEVLGHITAEDLPALAGRQQAAIPSAPQRLVQLRHAHHQLARLLAQGVEQNEIALITGYSPSYISNIQNDPQFADLMATYSSERELAFVDVLERMKSLGLTCLEELQERVSLEPEKWSPRELMELAELLLVKPSRGAPAGSGVANANASVAINVKFVGAPANTENVIDITPERTDE